MPASRRPTTTPWGLTPKEIEALELLIRLGNCKDVARRLGICLQSCEARFKRARDRMGTHTYGCIAAWAAWKAKQ